MYIADWNFVVWESDLDSEAGFCLSLGGLDLSPV